MKNEKGKARATRTTKGRKLSTPDDSRRKGRAKQVSRKNGDIGIGTDRADWTREYPSWGSNINGGILAQLIKSTEDQLSEAEACIEWYQRKKLDALKGLQELQRFKELAQREQESSSATQVSDEED